MVIMVFCNLVQLKLRTSTKQPLSAYRTAAVVAVMRGAAIIRAHDVRETVEALKLVAAVL